MKIKRTPVKYLKTERTPVRGPLILSRKDPRDDIEDFNKTMDETNTRAQKILGVAGKISNEVGYIENLTETNLSPTRLYHYQKKFMLDRNKYRHCDKSRQVGMSYSFSCEGYAKSQLMDIYTGVFVSYNQSEANDKINYARTLYESTPHKYRKKATIDRITAMEFEGRTSNGRKTRTRIISHPQREPRGKGFNTDVFLDEFAHYQWQQKVYVASVPIITRGLGQLSMASSPLGRTGIHYEVGANEKDFSMYSRHKIYWWDNPDFLKEKYIPRIAEVQEDAPTLTTEERVFKYGNDSIIQAYLNTLEEYFCQEYELRPLDEETSYYPMSLIRQCTFEVLAGFEIIDEEDIYGDNPEHTDSVYPGYNFKVYESLESLSRAVAKGEVGKRLFAGFDIGRNEDSSEVIIVEEVPEMNYFQSIRLIASMRKMEFRKQFQFICKLFKHLPIRLMKIDSTGMGKQLAEDLKKKFHSRIDPVHFTNEIKNDIATNFKFRLEDQTLGIPNDRDLIMQIYSIKRKVTEGNNTVRYEAEKSKKHHGDKFWSLALASFSGEPAQMHRVKFVSAGILQPEHKSFNRLLKPEKHRNFIGMPMAVGSVDYKKLPMPPFHAGEFAILSRNLDQI